jgi:alpha-tubulin suppressor-like RCC1 family protein
MATDTNLIPQRPTFDNVFADWNNQHLARFGTYVNTATAGEGNYERQVQTLKDQTAQEQAKWDAAYGNTPAGKAISENPPPTWQDSYNTWIKDYQKVFGTDQLNRPWSADADAVAQKQALDNDYLSSLAKYNEKNNTNIAPQAGVLGDNTSVSKSSPVQTVSGGTNWKQVAAGLYHAAAIKTDGTLWTWGYNSTGTLGDGSSIVNKSSPIQTVSGGTNWKQVAGGQSHAAAIKTDGTLWTWGYNAQGQVGDNSITHRSSPIQTVSGGTNWKQVASGGNNTAAIKTDGTLWLWGYNSGGQLGDNTSTHRSSPVQTIAGGTNWKSVSGGSAHTVAIKTDGTLWTWGQNTLGQLGDNTRINKFSPVQTIAGGTNWKSVSSGIAYTAAIKTDGTLWLWGHNNYGQLGDNTIVHRSSPVQTVSGGTNWKQVAGGGFNIASIKTDGTLWTWAYNAQGQLGDNTIVHRSSPIQTVSGGTNWKLVAAGQQHTSAIFFYEAGKLYPPS